METFAVALRVQVLGSARALAGSERHAFSVDKRHQLLAYLACHDDWVSRDRLADLFWSETETDLARQNLRKLLQRVQKLPWLAGLEVERFRVRWRIDTDLKDFRDALERGDDAAALAAYSGPLLPGLDGYDAGGFASWLEIERERLHIRWREVVFAAAGALATQGEHDAAAGRLTGLLEADGLDDEALAAFMQACRAAGRARHGLDAYARFATRLQRELALEPSSATKQLAEALEREPVPDPLPPLGWACTPLDASVPTPASSFVGRDLELADIARLLAQPECRLVTIYGPGGVGKTRLALQAASELATRYPGGVRFVALEAIASAGMVPATVAHALGIQLHGQGDPLEQVVRAIGAAESLLVLDNFEHLVPDSGLLTELLRGCPRLTLLVTSRERLDLDQEQALALEGFPLPADIAPRDALDYDAVRLFADRARRIRSSFVLDAEEAPAILHVCRLVEGLPLAIELAASWTRVMGAAEIAAEISRSIDFLSAAPRNANERHRSIRATFDHSWRLLAPREQDVLARLSVFRGGFEREGASFVAGANLALLAALVDKSLVRFWRGRYDLHPLLHAYVGEKLEGHPLEAETLRRHAEFFLRAAEDPASESFDARREAWLERLDGERENLRKALGWAAQHEVGMGLRLAVGLRHHWLLRGLHGEGRTQLTELLAHAATLPRTVTLTRAYLTAGIVAMAQADYGASRAHFDEALTLGRGLGQDEEVARALNNLGVIAIDLGDDEGARARFEEALPIARRIENLDLTRRLSNNLGILASRRGDTDAARKLYRDALAVSRAMGDRRGLGELNNLGLQAWHAGDHAEARALLEEFLHVVQELRDPIDTALALSNLSYVATDEGDIEGAARFARESLTLRRELDDRHGIAYCFEAFGSLAALGGEPLRAARLWGAAEALRETLGTPIPPEWRARYVRHIDSARASSDPARFSAAWHEGRGLHLPHAVDFALEAAPDSGRVRR